MSSPMRLNMGGIAVMVMRNVAAPRGTNGKPSFAFEVDRYYFGGGEKSHGGADEPGAVCHIEI